MPRINKGLTFRNQSMSCGLSRVWTAPSIPLGRTGPRYASASIFFTPRAA